MPSPGRTRVTVDLSGPFFSRDPSLTVKGNIRRMMAGLAEEGEQALRDDIRGLPLPRATGWTRDHAVGRVRSNTGKSWMATAVISANTAGMGRNDAIRTKAAAASVERRFHPFRRTASAIRRSRKILGANLTKGIE
jgi:hypothetical protein